MLAMMFNMLYTWIYMEKRLRAEEVEIRSSGALVEIS